jgi:TfoX/Sxy family transcriptional regulator of competence genes
MGDADYLLEVLERAAEGLPAVTRKFMFGCHALFGGGKIFSLVWDGRIAVKVPAERGGDDLLRLPGAEPWSPMKTEKGMRSWVLVPERMHEDDEALRPWVERAHAAALEAAKAGATASWAKKSTKTKKARKKEEADYSRSQMTG